MPTCHDPRNPSADNVGKDHDFLPNFAGKSLIFDLK
jgi:hypothetical protein